MATEATEFELLAGGLDANGATKGRWAQNLFWRNGTAEVRPAFGQVHQFDTRLRMPPSQTFLDTNKFYGTHEILCSTAFVTDFGHTQVVTLLGQQTWTGNTKYRGDFLPTLALHVWDRTTGKWWQEPLHVHTADNSGVAQPMSKWRAYGESNYDDDFADVIRGRLTGDPTAIPEPSNDFGTFMAEFDDAIFFGAPWLGLWCYRPADFLGSGEWQRDGAMRADFAPVQGESACVFRINAATGAFRDQYAYLDSAGFPAPVDVVSLNGSLAIADATAVYFSDPGRPNCIIGLNVLTVQPNEPIRGIAEAAGNLLIWSNSETYLFQPGVNFPANGTLTKLSNDTGIFSAQTKCKIAGGVAWADAMGVYTSPGNLSIKPMADAIKAMFNSQMSNPWSSFAVASGATSLAGEQPRSFFDMADVRGLNMAYDQTFNCLFLSVPAHRLVMFLQDGKWSAWSFESVVHAVGATPDVLTTHQIKNLHLSVADGRVFAVGGCEVYTPDDKTKLRGVASTGVYDPSGSAYILEWGHGGALDRSVDKTEDNRDFAGFWEEFDSPLPLSGLDTTGAYYLGKPVRLPAGYNVLPSQDFPVTDTNEVWIYPLYLRPPWALATLPPDILSLVFYFDNAQWRPVFKTGLIPEVSSPFPPERSAALEGFGFGAPIPGVAEIQCYNSGTGLPSFTGDQIRVNFTGATGATPWAAKPNMNLTRRHLNPICWLPFRKLTGTEANCAMSLGVSMGSASTQTTPNAAIPADLYTWHSPYIPNRHDLDDTAQPIDWAYKGNQFGEDSEFQVKTRGLYLRMVQHGKGTSNAFTSWPWGLVNATVGADWKDWSGQIIDQTNGAVRVDVKDPSLRSRFKDITGTPETSQRVMDSTSAKPPTFGDSTATAKGNFLVDDEQFDTVAISEEVRGEFFSWMLFGHVRDKAERLALHSAKATVRKVGGRRRTGR